jgi:hypothetical protein
MTIAPLDRDSVAFVARHMRAEDRAEIFATRFDDDAGAIADEMMALTFAEPVWPDQPPLEPADTGMRDYDPYRW